MLSGEHYRNVFRDLIEEHRDSYSVSYQPADARSPIATLSLFFPESPGDTSVVAKAMEKEMEAWLKRFPVPVKVSAFNARKRPIRLSATLPSESHLMAYVRLFDSAIVRRWGAMDIGEIPPDTYEAEHLEAVYKSLPFRFRDEDRFMARLELRSRVKAIALVISLVLIFPALMQAVLHWGQGFVLTLTLLSAGVGAYKGAGVMGWRKPNRWEERKAERIARKEHYFYHCEKNPASFSRMEKDNLKREVTRESKNAKERLQSVTVRKKRSRPRWIGVPWLFRAKRAAR